MWSAVVVVRVLIPGVMWEHQFDHHSYHHMVRIELIVALVAAAADAREPGAVFKYWGHSNSSESTEVWGQPIDGKDIKGDTQARNVGRSDEMNRFWNNVIHTETSELTARPSDFTNCEALHSSANGLKHCLIGGKCGPCPVKTLHPTPAPTPAPTVPVPHKCVRTGRNGNILGAVPFGWSGVGADNKYCVLEQCDICQTPSKRTSPYDDQLYCDMTPHSDMSESGNGACGKHQFTEDCEFVSCTYSPSEGMQTVTDQGSRGYGLFPEADRFLNGDQHECRATLKVNGSWGCVCKCGTSPVKWSYTNGLSDKHTGKPGPREHTISVGTPTTLPAGSIALAPAGPQQLLRLTKMVINSASEYTTTLAARSYDGLAWEATAAAAGLKIECGAPRHTQDVIYTSAKAGGNVCVVRIPSDGRYQLELLDTDDADADAMAARFVTLTSFGPTSADIAAFKSSAYTSKPESWLKAEMEKPATLHRAFFRERANPPAPDTLGDMPSGTVHMPCVKDSRWRSYVFSVADHDHAAVEAEVHGNEVSLKVNGHIIAVRPASEGWQLLADHPDMFVHTVSQWVGGQVLFKSRSTGQLLKFKNPKIEGFYPPADHVLFATDKLVQLPTSLTRNSPNDLKLLSESLPGIQGCAHTLTGPVYALDKPTGQLYVFDRRMDLARNTLDAPVVKTPEDLRMKCPTVPKTFLNAKTCVTNVKSCSPVTFSSATFTLDELIVKQWFKVGGLNVHAVTGIPLTSTKSPCSSGEPSRWVQRSTACIDSLDAGSKAIIAAALSASSNPLARTVVLSGCTAPAGAMVSVDGTCWQHAHIDELEVFDFSYMALQWKGEDDFLNTMANRVSKIADNGEAKYQWEDSAAEWTLIKNHGRYRMWHLGTLGDTMDFTSLPVEVQQEQIARIVGAEKQASDQGFEACGSPGEVPNDPSFGSAFKYGLGDNEKLTIPQKTDLEYHMSTQDIKQTVWYSVALQSNDQLRQRMAWALSQILVVNEVSVNKNLESEMWLAYYDIFVRNAFGNYRDVLREVSHSPAMGRMLSFVNSESFKISGVFPDENYAREVMQLFSIGLDRLNDDGTKIMDDNGAAVSTYDIEDIESLARAWTGFKTQLPRTNMEHVDSFTSQNFVDPMRYDTYRRDQNPKRVPGNGFIGDGLPLCADLPKASFLRKGATFRYLGRDIRPTSQFTSSKYSQEARVFSATKGSALYSTLCGNTDGPCVFPAEVTLDENLACAGAECAADMVPTVTLAGAGRMDDGTTYDVTFEYIHQPCVGYTFFNDGATVTGFNGNAQGAHQKPFCANKNEQVAQPTCCDPSSSKPTRGLCYLNEEYKYSLEHTTYHEAQARCEANGKTMCDFTKFRRDDKACQISRAYFWRESSCQLLAQITAEGQISVVDELATDITVSKENPLDNADTYRVHWDGGDFPTAESGCGGCTTRGNTCVCAAKVAEAAVFTALPSRADVVSKLSVGAVDPSTFDAGTYVLHEQSDDVTVYFLNSNSGYNTDAVVKITDGSASSKPLFFKNLVSTVAMGDSKHSFRNPVKFFNAASSIVRSNVASEQETMATIDFYFDHPNTPPFISKLLIQRFVTSNPSPRYVKTVTTAFKTGSYRGFGTGSRGDLAATLAAILLDSEATNPALASEPTHGRIREPLIKYMHVLRAGGFTATHPSKGGAILHMSGMARLGEVPYEAESVFNFFEQGYTPDGALMREGLTAPEGVLLSAPEIVGFINGAQSFIRHGLTDCAGGLSGAYQGRNCGRPDRYNPIGTAEFLPSSASPAAAVRELDVLFTGGRASPRTLDLIERAYTAELAKAGATAALKVAQQLFVATPEFHTTAAVGTTTARKAEAAEAVSSAAKKPYKAIVYLYFSGGADSFNMLVPYDQCANRDMYAHYADVRSDVSIPKQLLLPIEDKSDSQVCKRFGMHPSLKTLHKMYNTGDAMWFANAGNLAEPVKKSNQKNRGWTKAIPKPLFSHNTQRLYAQNVDSYRSNRANGAIGRMMDSFARDGTTHASYSMHGKNAIALSPIKSKPYNIVSREGVTTLHSDSDAIRSAMMNMTDLDAESPFAQTWFDQFRGTIKSTDEIHDNLEYAHTVTNFPANKKDNKLGEQMNMVAKMMKANTQSLHHERNAFFVNLNGFDVHNEALAGMTTTMSQVDEALASFEAEMKAQGLWDSVTIVQASEFGRTLTSNGGGTDHAWGGNYFVAGGAIAGGKILGQYPDNLSSEGKQILKRGRVMPTTSWEMILNGVGEWFGVNDKDMDEVLPNRKNFQNYKASDLY